MNLNSVKIRREKDTNFQRVTPALAQELLDLNYSGQRRVSKMVVDKYAEDMRCGRWGKMNSDPICFHLNPDGSIKELCDGQHRLLAVIQSGTTQYFEFAEEKEKNFKYLDQGKNRDVSSFIHYNRPHEIAALARRIIKIKYTNSTIAGSVSNSGENDNKQGITPQRVLAFVYENEAELPSWTNYIQYGTQIVRGGLCGKGSKTTASLFCWLLVWLDKDGYLEEFIDDMKTDLSESVSVRLLKDYYQKSLANGFKPSPSQLICHLIWAYDNFKSCRYKKYPTFPKVLETVEKYDQLVSKKRRTK